VTLPPEDPAPGPISEEDLARREAAVAAGEQALANRTRSVDLRELAQEDLDRTSREGAEAHARSDAELREANERLVVATVSAQTMTEVAERATAQMAHMAQHDFLTGLPNRSLLTDRLEQSLALARRYQRKVALLYLDLDNFKYVNDSLGHVVGDELLQSAAQRLLRCVRRSDTVSRQGGDEFVVLLNEVRTLADATLTAEQVLLAMAEPHLVAGQRLHVSLSIGVTLFPDDGESPEALIQTADTAMYQAKQAGRNTYRVFTPDMNARAVVRQSVEQALHHALEQRGFVLHYQPKVNLESGAITGAEALVRMRAPGEGLVGPTDFVGVAEDSGLIVPLGRWVLREACRQTAAWVAQGLQLRHIAVNVSATELHDPSFLAGVRGVLEETGLDPRRLELELTESGLIRDVAQTRVTLQALRDLGVQIAIDDFGTGYSSLSYLRHFPIDTLKLDQSFMRDVGDVAGDAIITAVIAMGRSLEHRVVAEGIETPQQLAFLRSKHCPEGQGYLFSQPVDAEAFAALLPSTQEQGPGPGLVGT
jgi:diguanylate cyclase (GGDEF)-like protein